jgi:hypothetical protein
MHPTGAEFQKLRESLLRSKRAVKVLTGTDAAKVTYGLYLMSETFLSTLTVILSYPRHSTL